MPRPGFSLDVTPAQLREAAGIGDRTIAAALFQAGLTLQNEWMEMLSQPGHGSFYPKGIRFVTIAAARKVIAFFDEAEGRLTSHTASAPWEPPAPDTGAGRASIAIDDHDLLTRLRLRVGTNVRVLLALEFGVNYPGSRVRAHPGGIIIEPRPHARPAKETAVPRMNDRIVAVLRTGR